MYDVIIIGAGIVGCAIARDLSQYNVKVAVLEASNDIAMGATKANSAIVHGGYAESHDKIKGRLCFKGRQQFRKLNEELNFGFSMTGSLVLAFSDSDLPKLEALKTNGIKNGLTDLEIWNHEQILVKEPNINREVRYALYCDGAGITSPYEMAIALMENAIHNGVKLYLNTPCTNIQKERNIFHVKSANHVFNSSVVINASGLSSQLISNMVGIDNFTITPRSGQYLLFARGPGKLVHHVLFQMPSKMGKGILVTPTYHGNLLLGPDAIDESGINKATDVNRLIHIYQQAKQTTPHIDPTQFIRSFAGVRAVSSTDDFILGESTVSGFIQCAGIQSPGLTSSPAIADYIVGLIDEKYIKLNRKTNFDPYRKPIIEKKELRSMKEIAPLVALDRGDNRIVCRCEQVDEKTIRDAMTREIPVTTIDGIKRRTRAGMGFCQGTFCRPRVKALMEEILVHEINDEFDVEHSGINRVGKSEFLDFLSKETK